MAVSDSEGGAIRETGLDVSAVARHGAGGGLMKDLPDADKIVVAATTLIRAEEVA